MLDALNGSYYEEIYQVAYEILVVREIFNASLIVALAIFAGFFILRSRKEEKGSAQRNIFLGYCLFLCSYAITRIFFVFSDVELWFAYDHHGLTNTILNEIYVGIGYSAGILGALCLLIMIERYLIRTRYIFSILAIGIFILSVISIFPLIPTDIPQTIITVVFPVFFGVILLLYLYVVFKSAGEARKKAIGIVLGLLVMIVGFLFGSALIGDFIDPAGLYIIRILIEPFVVILGSAIFTLSQR